MRNFQATVDRTTGQRAAVDGPVRQCASRRRAAQESARGRKFCVCGNKSALFFVLAFLLTCEALSFGKTPSQAPQRASNAPGKLLSAWVELTGTGPSVRAIVQDGGCPVVRAGFERRRMLVRQAASAAFPVTVCEVGAPRFARHIEVGDRTLNLIPHRLRRIVVFGDTGCRLKGAQMQDCNDAQKWPFAIIMRNAAAKHPDLAVHVGDYYYRETPCAAGDAGCAGSPHGDAWASWSADFFQPASPLLAAAPWVFARGNHEQCGRGADGWFRMLDAGPAPLTCPAIAAPFGVDLPGLDLKVIDTADMADLQLGPQKVLFYQSQLNAIPKRLSVGSDANSPEWIVTHRPIWGFELTSGGEGVMAQNKAVVKVFDRLDKPAAPQLPEAEMILSGHVHFFAALDFGPLRPAQLITGDGGTLLIDAQTRSGQQVIDGLLTQFAVSDTYGYFLLERKKQAWMGTLYGANDAVLTRCTFQGRAAKCAPVAK